MKKITVSLSALFMCVLAFAPGNVRSSPDRPVIDGVFGLTRVDTATAVAFWVPLGQGEMLTGFSWYNNDGSVTFPEVRALAADLDRPELLDGATVVGQDLVGGDSAWSDYEFPVAVSSEATGLYVILQMPEGSVCHNQGHGGGAGVGYCRGNGTRQCWFTAGGEPWEALSGDFQMAVQFRTSADKSQRSLRIARSGDSPVAPGTHLPIAGQLPGLALGAFPNPFNPSAKMVFSLPVAGDVDLTVFDVRGARVKVLHHGFMEAGEHSVTWGGRNEQGQSVASGMYLARLTTKDGTRIARLTMLE